MHEKIWYIYTKYLETWYDHIYYLLDTVSTYWVTVYPEEYVNK